MTIHATTPRVGAKVKSVGQQDTKLVNEGFEAYQRAREAVLRMRQAPGGATSGSDASTYWSAELSNIDYMIEATPLIVRKLRHHAFHITGIRPYDYRERHDARRQFFEARLRALRAVGGDSLLLPEHPALGGFGYDIDDRLYNVDTLKYFETLVAMDRGGVLDPIRRAARPVVCEIGAGWGGFAYQFKTLVPDSVYLIIDFPELFTFSATYLGTLFPDARLSFHDGADPARLEASLRSADFVFVPHGRTADVAQLRLDLLVNMVSFQEMTDAQVRAYGRMAFEASCRTLYSLNRHRSPYNAELRSVSAALAETYRLREVAVLSNDYTTAMKREPLTPVTGGRAAWQYRHLIGARREEIRPRVVLGMTLYNQARHLPEAIESLLAQTATDFVLVLLDDGSTDATRTVAKGYAVRDPRVRYHRHADRQGVIAAWRELVDLAERECPTAEYFAWVNDHDRWAPGWLEALRAELDTHSEAVLAYPLTARMTPAGEAIDAAPRRFDTAACVDTGDRWRRFCRRGVGAGDMVHGLVRLEALRDAGTFRTVLRPDRLVVAELVLRGSIHQVAEPLWMRREAESAGVGRQHQSLMVGGTGPPGFRPSPWGQHTRALRRAYDERTLARLGISRDRWRRMLREYRWSFVWHHLRTSKTSTLAAKGAQRLAMLRKTVKHRL